MIKFKLFNYNFNSCHIFHKFIIPLTSKTLINIKMFLYTNIYYSIIKFLSKTTLKTYFKLWLTFNFISIMVNFIYSIDYDLVWNILNSNSDIYFGGMIFNKFIIDNDLIIFDLNSNSSSNDGDISSISSSLFDKSQDNLSDETSRLHLSNNNNHITEEDLIDLELELSELLDNEDDLQVVEKVRDLLNKVTNFELNDPLIYLEGRSKLYSLSEIEHQYKNLSKHDALVEKVNIWLNNNEQADNISCDQMIDISSDSEIDSNESVVGD